MAIKKFLVCGDNHGALVSDEALSKLLGFADEFKPHYRVHLGDVWDFAALRRTASQEDKACGVSDDYAAGLRFLDMFKPQYLTLGNHDARIWDKAENSLDGMLKERCSDLVASSIAEFERRKIKWVPYKVGECITLPEGGPRFIHGFRSTIYTAKAHFENWGSCIHGHCHTADEYVARHIAGGKAFSVGCMADIDQLTYGERMPSRLGHRMGFLYGYIAPQTGHWNAWNITKENGIWLSPHGQL